MSSKKSKGKNRQHKPPNPTPPLLKESVEPAEKEVELKEEATEIVKEERVPEIESAVIPEKSDIPECETVETPNKPKRNRGKKKKDKDDENADIKCLDPVIEQTKLTVDSNDDQQVLEKEPFEVVPTARKKKNKHKKHLEQSTEQGKPLETDSLELQVVVACSNKDDEKIETGTVQEAPLEVSERNEHENKSSKKKNKKKKNRNDSEKSDKVEDISLPVAETEKTDISVASALDSKNEKIEEKQKGDTSGYETSIIDDSSTSECTIKEVSISTDKEKNTIETLTKKEKETEVNPTLISTDDSGKSKKKKKDKKQVTQEKIEVELQTTTTIKESSTPKTELSTKVNTVDSPVLSTEDKSIWLMSSTETSKNVAEVEKSPKPKAKIAEPVDKKDNYKIQTTEPTTQKDTVPIDLSVEASSTTEIKSDISLEEKVDLKQEVIKEKDEKIIQKQETQLISTPEGSMGKKRKKSPKLPKQDFKQKIEEKVETLEGGFKEVESDNVKVEELVASQASQMPMPSVSDIMQESTKSHESLDMVPDLVEYPRSNSEQPLDNNNNMIIQEVIIEKGKLEVPTDIPDTPFVQGSGETPVMSPELIATGIKVTEIQFTEFKGEKTDLKSKVMEVNQDMEELRLSIEKSLAELTAIEKCEEEKEKQFEVISDSKAQALPKDDSKKQDLILTAITVSDQSSKSDKSKSKEQIIDKTEEPTKTRPTEIIEMKILPDSHTLLEPEKSKSEPIMEIKLDETHTHIISDMTGTSKAVDDINKSNVEGLPHKIDTNVEFKQDKIKTDETLQSEKNVVADTTSPPVCPARRDHKGKGGKKKKDKQPREITTPTSTTSSTDAASKSSSQEVKKDEKVEQKSEKTQEKGKQQSGTTECDQANIPTKNKLQDKRDEIKNDSTEQSILSHSPEFDPIENFEDALTSSVDDVNKSFEVIANEVNEANEASTLQQNPQINITESDEKDKDKNQEKNEVPQPKNLLGHIDIPVQSNKTDYKKEKNKTPNSKQAKVKIKDSTQIETAEEQKQSKECQTKLKLPKDNTVKESISTVANGNDEYVYKYSFRRVFLPSACHVCKKELKNARVACNFCNLIFYCCLKHRDDDVSEHQALCFAVSTIVHLKDQKHIYADATDVVGHNYRLLRMQMIVSCEKVLKRKLVPWEQEALLYPRICADPSCREWKQNNLKDCDGCGQISYCSEYPDHFPKSHQRWCKSYCLYQKLVCYQQIKGRLEPKLPTKVMPHLYQIPEKINEVLASMYEEKIDMNDLQYAALTQLATAPLTAVYSYQLWNNKVNTIKNGLKKSSFTIHVVGAELQFEADALNKWETFFLHLRSDINDLNIVLIAPDLNPSNLPLDLLGNIKLCENCKQNNRRIRFNFHDNMNYNAYWSSDFFVTPDLVCAFNVSIQRSSSYNGKDSWPSTITCILKSKAPLLLTSYTSQELHRDLARIKEICFKSDIQCTVMSEPKYNSYASVRPDRNFISDDEMPLLFKNYCFSIIYG